MELIPPYGIRAVADVMTFGARKYGDRNWEKGIQASRLVGAAERHINSRMQGEHLDPDSNLDHLAHAAASLLMAMDLLKQGAKWDDLPRYSNLNPTGTSKRP